MNHITPRKFRNAYFKVSGNKKANTMDLVMEQWHEVNSFQYKVRIKELEEENNRLKQLINKYIKDGG